MIEFKFGLFDSMPDSARYCKYCYGDHDMGIGDDGSLLVCSNCNAGLAPLDEVLLAGYDAFVQKITAQFVAEHRGSLDD